MKTLSDALLDRFQDRSRSAVLQTIAFVIACFGGTGSAFSQELVSRSCWKPNSPIRSDYKNELEYSVAKEEYYSQATFYLNCLDGWVKETEARYREMFEAEIEAYALERAELLDEIRTFTNNLRQ